MANKQVQLTTQTPLRLQPAVCAAFIKQCADLITENGASYALNHFLAETLRKRGHSIPELETPLERIAQAQKRRWRTTKQAQRTEEKEALARKQRKAETDKARRLRLKAVADSTPDE